jgi:hypothetical protein
MGVNPLEQLPLIFQSIIETQSVVLKKLFTGKKPIRANSVVEIHNNNTIIGSFDQFGGVVVGVAIRAEAASLNEDVDGQLALSSGIGRCPHVGKQAIFRVFGVKLIGELSISAYADGAELGKT